MPYPATKEVRKKEKRLSAALTIIIWGSIMMFFFMYRITMPKENDKKEVVTTMLINFGDNRNGIDEPMEQEGSKVKTEGIPTHTPSITPQPSAKTINTTQKDKIISGKSDKTTINKNENKESTKKTNSKNAATKQNAKQNNTGSPSATGSKKTNANGGGDGQGNAAIGNLIKGRGTKPGSQGTGTGIGNAGDPLGGDGNGDSKTGVDRKLIGFIPGTMGRGGSHPKHDCTATGTIVIGYTVDKTGSIRSAKVVSGTTDPCISSTAIGWVKKYVKAEKANFSSTGTYKITF